MNRPLEQARVELQVFPRGSYPQNLFRAVFFALREHSLGKKATVRWTFEETAREAVSLVRERFPAFVPTVAV